MNTERLTSGVDIVRAKLFINVSGNNGGFTHTISSHQRNFDLTYQLFVIVDVRFGRGRTHIYLYIQTLEYCPKSLAHIYAVQIHRNIFGF